MKRILKIALAGFAAAALAASLGAIGPGFRANEGKGKDRHRRRRADVSQKNIIQNAVNSKDHTTLVAAVKAAGLVDTLSGTGPFTVFAPTNEAFAKLPAGTVETLLKPENKAKLTKILTYHVVAADAMSTAIKKMIKDDGGKHTIKTVGGCTLTAKMKGDKLVLDRRQGRRRHGHHRQRQAVERRHPRDRHRAVAGLIVL